MEPPSLRVRLLFEDGSILTQKQRTLGMNHSWLLIESNQHPKISDICNHLLHKFNLRNSCPDGILLFMEGYVLPPSELTRILKDNDIICVKRNRLTLGEVTDGEKACNLLDEGENNRGETVNNGMLLLANEEFDKETGGYESESEDEKLEELLTKEIITKKRKVSKKLQSSKKKQKRSTEIDDVEDEVLIEDENINDDECIPVKSVSKKIKPNKEKKSDKSVKSPSKDKRKKKHCSAVMNGADDVVMTVKIDNDNNGEEVKQESTAPDGAKKGTSRNAKRKKAKRKWKRELANISQNLDTHQEPEVSRSENKEANGHSNGHEDQVSAKLVDKNMMEQKERKCDDNVINELVPRVIRPGHIRFEPEDEEDINHIEVPEVAFQWNGITSKKKGQKWGLEKFSTFQKDDSQNATEENQLTMLTADTQLPLVDLVDFDQLPLCSSPKVDDVIAYRVLELTSSWTPEISSFRVGKVSEYDGNNVVLIPVPEYPIVSDKMDEDGPENSLYKEDGSLEIKFAALVDVRSVKQSKSETIKSVSNGINQNTDKDDDASKLLSSSNGSNKNLSKDPNSVVAEEKEIMTWDELNEALNAKKSELMEINEEIKKDCGRNKWSYRALRGSAIGPTMAMLRSSNNI